MSRCSDLSAVSDGEDGPVDDGSRCPLTDMAIEVLRPVCFGNIATDLLPAVVLLVHCLSDQIQAVQLVERLDTGAVTPFSRYRVLDFQGSRRETQLDSLLLCDHDIAN